jgi:hypothetical protein
LQELDLRAHSLSDNYGGALATALPLLPHVRALRLRDNRLTDAALVPIVAAARKIPGLKRLDLGRNKIDTLGAAEIYALLGDHACPLEVSCFARYLVNEFECKLIWQFNFSGPRVIECRY